MATELDSTDEGQDPGAEGGGAQRNRLSSVTTAVRVLKAFTGPDAELGISPLAKKLGVAKSTVHRIVVTLVAEGLLEQNKENDRYRLGIGLFALGTLVRQRMNLSSEARPYLFDLREITGETILLGVPTENGILYVYNLESPKALRMRSDIGVRIPAHCSALGKVIFAHGDDAARDAILAGDLSKRTAATITNPAKLRREFDEIRARGYGFDEEESEPGIRAVAAPIRGADGQIIGAVGVAGPTQRLGEGVLETHIDALLRTVDAISTRLGWRPNREGTGWGGAKDEGY